jgi:hypothetical protein
MTDPSWQPVPGWEGFYAAARSGLVTSLDRTVQTSNGPRRYKARMLAWTINEANGGYPEVALSRPGQKPQSIMVHQIILRTFVGECPEGQESRHGPLGKLVPALHNLCYGTRAENTGPDRLRDGQDNRGENHGAHKLTAAQVLDIRGRRESGEYLKDIAARYDIAFQTVSAIARRQQWSWLD